MSGGVEICKRYAEMSSKREAADRAAGNEEGAAFESGSTITAMNLADQIARATTPCAAVEGAGIETVRDGDAEWVRCKLCGHEGAVKLAASEAIAAWNTRALSPPPTITETVTVALPAPGEVERALILARDLIAVVEQTSGNVWWVNADDPETAVCDTSTAIDKALATVAAANDEGLAGAFARGVEAAAKVCDEQRDFADANLKVQHRPAHYAGVRSAAIEGAIRIRRLLPQGGGK